MTTEITTVIPTYRRPRLLARAIRSVLAQDYPHFEVHVYDNASGDETPDVVSRFARLDSRVKYHVHPRNLGRTANTVYAVANTNTPLLHILSDDEIILPSFFRTAVCALDRAPEAGFFLGGILFADPRGNVIAAPLQRWSAEGLLRPTDLFSQMLPGSWLNYSGTLFRTDILPTIGGFRAANSFDDIDMMMRAAVRYPGFVCRRPCSVFLMHGGQSTIKETPPSLGHVLSSPPLPGVENAIAAAEASGAITLDDAEHMRLRFRTARQRSLFRRAIGLLASGDATPSGAHNDLLKQTFGTRVFADILRVVSSGGLTGQMSRATLRIVRNMHIVAVLFLAKHRYRNHTRLVKQMFRRLDDDVPNGSDALPSVASYTNILSDLG